MEAGAERLGLLQAASNCFSKEAKESFDVHTWDHQAAGLAKDGQYRTCMGMERT
jgi:hypothetical protein